MPPFQPSETFQALRILSDAAEQHRDEITGYDVGPATDDSDEENESSSPVMDAFFESGGAKAICEMTNFTPSEFTKIWLKLQILVLENWNVGRGRKSQQKAKDIHASHCAQARWKLGFFGQNVSDEGPDF